MRVIIPVVMVTGTKADIHTQKSHMHMTLAILMVEYHHNLANIHATVCVCVHTYKHTYLQLVLAQASPAVIHMLLHAIDTYSIVSV